MSTIPEVDEICCGPKEAAKHERFLVVGLDLLLALLQRLALHQKCCLSAERPRSNTVLRKGQPGDPSLQALAPTSGPSIGVLDSHTCSTEPPYSHS